MNQCTNNCFSKIVSLGAAAYSRIETAVCGRHPHPNPLHFQWLAGKDLYPTLKRHLPCLRGRVLDLGCGEKPYRDWATQASEYVGADLVAGPGVDHILKDGERWPFPDASFDSLLSTQVIEHVRDLHHCLQEMRRVLKPDGTLLLSFPFIYPSHGEPHDYRRLSLFGAKELIESLGPTEVLALETQGAIGSTLGLLFLNWLETQSTRHVACAILKFLCLPLWWGLCAGINLLGMLLDSIDSTNRYYLNVVILARRVSLPQI